MKFTPKRSVLLPLTIIFLLLAVQAVSAASQSGNIFDSFKNIFGGSDFGQLYKDNWWIVDLIVYVFFFSYIGKMALGQQFEGKGGPIGIVFGVALAIALVAFEAKNGFQLGNLGPYALAVLVLALAFITWKFFHGIGMGNGGAAAFAVVVVYGTLATVASPLLKALKDSDNSTIQMFASSIDLLLLVAVIAVAWKGFGFVFGMFKGGGSSGLGGLSEAFTHEKKEEEKEAAGEKVEKAEETAEEKEERRIQGLIGKVAGLEKRNYQDADRMIKDVDEIIRLIQSNKSGSAVIEAITEKLGEISVSEADVKQITAALRGAAAELDAYEKDEVSKAKTALENARRIANVQITNEWKKSNLNRKVTQADITKLTAIQKKVETDIEAQAVAQWSITRKELDAHIASIAAAETQLPNLFMRAVEYLKAPGRMQSAVSSLQATKGLLVKIKAAIASVEKLDIPRIKQKIGRTMKDLQVEKSLADRLTKDFLKPT